MDKSIHRNSAGTHVNCDRVNDSYRKTCSSKVDAVYQWTDHAVFNSVVSKAEHKCQMLTQTKQIACKAIIIVFIIVPVIAIVLIYFLAFDPCGADRLRLTMLQQCER